MRRDLVSNIAEQLFFGAALSNTTAATYASSLVDTQGFQSFAILFSIGVGGITFTSSNKIEYQLQHGNASDGSDLANVAVTDLLGVASVTNGIVKSLVAAHASADVTEVGYIGSKRYLQLNEIVTGTHGTGTPRSVILVQSHGEVRPS